MPCEVIEFLQVEQQDALCGTEKPVILTSDSKRYLSLLLDFFQPVDRGPGGEVLTKHKIVENLMTLALSGTLKMYFLFVSFKYGHK